MIQSIAPEKILSDRQTDVVPVCPLYSKSGRVRCNERCPLWAKSGHSPKAIMIGVVPIAQSELAPTLAIERERPCAVDQIIKRNKKDRE